MSYQLYMGVTGASIDLYQNLTLRKVVASKGLLIALGGKNNETQKITIQGKTA